MTKLVKNFEIFDKLTQRDFNVEETIELLMRFNPTVFYSWGVERITNFKNKGLLLKVNAHHHKERVFIILAWNDTYSFYLMDSENKVIKESHEVYFDELQYKIDQTIEYIDEYK